MTFILQFINHYKSKSTRKIKEIWYKKVKNQHISNKNYQIHDDTTLFVLHTR